MPALDPAFLDIPLDRLAETALSRARDLGAAHADFRLECVRYQTLSARDGQIQGTDDDSDLGFAVRVLLNGVWGFAATTSLSHDGAVNVAERAVRVAQVAAPMTRRRVSLAPEPVHRGTWVSAYDINPFEVPHHDKSALLCDWTARLLANPEVEHAAGSLELVQENKFYADLAGSHLIQQRVRVQPHLEVFGSWQDRFDSMASIAAPVGQGWEYLIGGYDFDDGLLSCLSCWQRSCGAFSPSRTYDLAIHPQQPAADDSRIIWHATELDLSFGLRSQLRPYLLRHPTSWDARLRLTTDERDR